MFESDKVTRQIGQWLEGSMEDALQLPVTALHSYEQIFEPLMQEGTSSSFETNGWQVDFFWPVVLNGKQCLFTGSLFYGDYKLVEGR